MTKAWIVMCVLFHQPTGPAITTLMQDGHVYADKGVCQRSPGYADLVKFHKRMDEVTNDKTDCACVSEKIVRH